MVRKMITVICDNCDSSNVTTKEKIYNKKYRLVKDASSLDRAYTSLESVDIKLICHCNNCGKDFEEKLGTEKYDLQPGEIEI